MMLLRGWVSCWEVQRITVLTRDNPSSPVLETMLTSKETKKNLLEIWRSVKSWKKKKNHGILPVWRGHFSQWQTWFGPQTDSVACLFSLWRSLDDYLQVLEKEVNIDFCRSMNRIIFDKTVRENPQTFAFVTLPEKEVESVPEKGKCASSAENLMFIVTIF